MLQSNPFLLLPKPPLSLLFKLGIDDLMHDRKVSFFIMASIVAVVAPLLLLFGLKFGIVSQMRAELIADPRNLEIRMLGSAKLDDAWFTRFKQIPGLGFVQPMTRSLNTIGDLYVDGRHFIENAELIPTAQGDPVLNNISIPIHKDEVVLTSSAALRLGVKEGDLLRLRVARIVENRSERAQIPLRVVGVLPATAFNRPAAFLQLPLLVDIEDFRDGFKVKGTGVETGETPLTRNFFARARIYADRIESVESLSALLLAEGIETSSRLAEIKSVQSIDKVLGLIFAVIAWIALLGCAASLIGALMANIDRKRKDLALLRLMGYSKNAMQLYVVVQACALTLAGFVVGCLLYLVGSYLFNQLLGAYMPAGQFVCRLEPIHFFMALCAALLVAIFVAGVGGGLATKIEPAESLRDV
jgi:putative ABC transport system permease protein